MSEPDTREPFPVIDREEVLDSVMQALKRLADEHPTVGFAVAVAVRDTDDPKAAQITFVSNVADKQTRDMFNTAGTMAAARIQPT